MEPWLKRCLTLRLARIAMSESGGMESEATPVRMPKPAEESLPDPAKADPADVLRAAALAATSPANSLPEPTDAQKRAGNYAKGHVRLLGLDISVENPAGSYRRGVSRDGKAWSTLMRHHYGYVKGTVGYDKDHVDVFVNPSRPESAMVYVVNQMHPDTGAFDEHKAMIGWNRLEDAERAYLSNYEKGWNGAQSVTPMTVAEFKSWLGSGKAGRGPAINDRTVGHIQ